MPKGKPVHKKQFDARLVEVSENVNGNLVKYCGLSKYFVGLKNAFAHGDIFMEMGLAFTDQQVSDLHDKLSDLQAIANRIEKDNGM